MTPSWNIPPEVLEWARRVKAPPTPAERRAMRAAYRARMLAHCAENHKAAGGLLKRGEPPNPLEGDSGMDGPEDRTGDGT